MKKLVGYITAGVLEDSATNDLILKMAENGMDSIELGVPFSDPVADGPVIEKASMIALSNGFKFDRIYEITKGISSSVDTLWMGYFNPFYQKGVKNIAEKGASVGLKGLIIPDLPHEESIAYKDMFDAHDITLIDFVAPTDSKERIAKITKNSQKFIYLVAYAGITGTEKKEDLEIIVKNIKEASKTPVYVGFGVTKETAKEKAAHSDGVIVGSAFIKILLDDSLTLSSRMDKIARLTKDIKSIINE
ncbi:MAG: tryptophan synthase alpha chain [Campylobacterota bacterium]|nr:tryptophan synthase alpha chain [Campylobacterota bacterium]